MDKPKRRKHKDNPYTLICIDGIKYIVTFKNGSGKLITVEVTKEIYEKMNEFELDDLHELNQYDRHEEHSEVYENNLNKRALIKPVSLEDEIIQKSTFEELMNAIKTLPETQKRRIKKYYFDDKNEYVIAEEEQTSHQAVHKSLSLALESLKKILKKIKF